MSRLTRFNTIAWWKKSCLAYTWRVSYAPVHVHTAHRNAQYNNVINGACVWTFTHRCAARFCRLRGVDFHQGSHEVLGIPTMSTVVIAKSDYRRCLRHRYLCNTYIVETSALSLLFCFDKKIVLNEKTPITS